MKEGKKVEQFICPKKDLCNSDKCLHREPHETIPICHGLKCFHLKPTFNCIPIESKQPEKCKRCDDTKKVVEYNRAGGREIPCPDCVTKTNIYCANCGVISESKCLACKDYSQFEVFKIGKPPREGEVEKILKELSSGEYACCSDQCYPTCANKDDSCIQLIMDYNKLKSKLTTLIKRQLKEGK